MLFVTQTDLDLIIRTDALNQITLGAADPDALLTLAEAVAIDTIRGYLGGRYDCDAIFALTGADRNAHIIRITIDIMIYDLHSRSSQPRDIPDIRIRRYEDAIAWLNRAGRDWIIPDLPPLSSPTENLGTNRYGSQPKESNDF